MIKYFCDRCGKEVVNNNSCSVIKVETYTYNDSNFMVHENKGDYNTFLCGKCGILLRKFLENELDIDYDPNFLGY